jgi:uncharacterized membrane protein
MQALSFKPQFSHAELPYIALVAPWRPLRWLFKGARDFRKNWPLSLGLGVLIALIGWLMMVSGLAKLHWVITLLTGFILAGPFLASCFYAISRRLSQRRSPDLRDLGRLLHRNGLSIGLFTILLMFVMSTWELITAVLLSFFLGDTILSGNNSSLAWMAGIQFVAFLAVYIPLGAMLAMMVFTFSVVSLPLMLDRKVDVATALFTSFWVVRENRPAMLVWAVMIAILTVLSLATWLVGLAIVFPILGHATWHAYRELVHWK